MSRSRLRSVVKPLSTAGARCPFPLSPPPPSDTACKASLSNRPRRLCQPLRHSYVRENMHRAGNRKGSKDRVGMFTLYPGQPPQRPPALAPNPALGGPYRGTPYASYGMPQRNVNQGYPILPNQRTVVPQPSPNFLQQQQRGQSNFPYNASTLQQQQAQSPAQLTSQTTLSHAAHQQQTPGAGANSTLPPHIAQNAAPSLGTAPSVSSQSEVGLDPNDFPALGATPANNSSATSSANTTSYASQAGTGAGGSGAQAGNGAAVNQPRDFTAEDFPALGGQSQATQQQPQQAQQTPVDGHPPGLNGFQHNDPQHRQTLLGSLTGGVQGGQQQQQQPGLLNLGQARNVHPGFQSDTDKQRVCLVYARYMFRTLQRSDHYHEEQSRERGSCMELS